MTYTETHDLERMWHLFSLKGDAVAIGPEGFTSGRDSKDRVRVPVGTDNRQLSRDQVVFSVDDDNHLIATNIGAGLLRTGTFGDSGGLVLTRRMEHNQTQRLTSGDVVAFMAVNRTCACTWATPCVCGANTDCEFVLARWTVAWLSSHSEPPVEEPPTEESPTEDVQDDEPCSPPSSPSLPSPFWCCHLASPC